MGRRRAPILAAVAAVVIVVPMLPGRASFPGANGGIAFTSNRTGTFQIFTADADGSDVQHRTTIGVNYSPTWDPSGNKIAFVSERDGRPQLYVMNADGSDQHRITASMSRDRSPAWFPSGEKLVFESDRADGNNELFSINVDGTDLARLTTDPADDTRADVSVDNRIIFQSDRDGNLDLYVMDADGTNVHAVTATQSPVINLAPSWSPDGNNLAFVSTSAGSRQVHVANANGGAAVPVPNTDSAANPVWSPTGDKLLFERGDGADVQLNTINTDGTDASPATNATNTFNGEGDWQPKKCRARVTGGYFEPSQAVWQDDPTDTPLAFPDLPGKRLKYTGDPGGQPRYEAELPLVAGRPLLLFGIDHAVNGPTPHDRKHIVISGKTNCTTDVQVGMDFFVFAGTNPLAPYRTGPLGSVKLDGPPEEEETDWTITLDATNGVPPDTRFVLPEGKSYTIRNELYRIGSEPNEGFTGLFVQVTGPEIKTRGPTTLIVPALLSPAKGAQKKDLVDSASLLATNTQAAADDIFPIPTGGMKVTAAKEALRYRYPKAEADAWKNWVKQLFPKPTKAVKVDVKLAETENLWGGVADIAGAERVVLEVTTNDYAVLQPDEKKGRRSGGFTLPSKLIVVRLPSSFVVLHEIVHTLPFPFDNAEMQQECQRPGYHNTHEDIAHGFKIVGRDWRDPVTGLMSGGVAAGNDWIEQCTYWHLTKILQNPPPDPPVVMVQGRIATDGTDVIGRLGSAYTFDDIADLSEGAGGSYAIVLRNDAGEQLARYPFTPDFSGPIDVSTPRPSSVVGFSYRVPAVADTAAIELDGPTGVLATKDVSANAPTVAIDEPADGTTAARGEEVHVSWTASDVDGDALVYSVYLSTDGGATWLPHAFERTTASTNVELDDDTTIKVVATDGGRSTSAAVSVAVG